jgi:DNA polymerase-3 subunit epsilon/ATP-dependent DNA helicase DinG
MHPERDEVIEIGAVKFRDGQITGRWESFVRPTQPIPYKVTQLTGIKNSDVARAPHIHQVAPALIRFVGDSPIIGQSILLDMAMLARAGIKLPNAAWDTFELATLLVPEAAVYNLRAVAARLGIPVDEERAHRALADAELTMRVFLALRERIEELPLEVLSEINRSTARSDWPLRLLFQEVEHEKARMALTSGFGASLRAQLAAKGRSDAELDIGLLRPPVEDANREPVHLPYEGRQPVAPGEVEAVLKPGGAMAKVFPQYEYRPQQVEMAKAVAHAFNKGHHLIVEAGTGTGKSIGYLLPAILYSLRTGERVVVSTSTINLQDQLFTKDLPLLHRILETWGDAGLPVAADRSGPAGRNTAQAPSMFRSALLKGKSNYICLRRWYMFRRNPPASIDQLRVMVKVLIWLPVTGTGDRSELLLLNDETDVWGHLCVSEEGCPLYECRVRQKGLCFYDRARRQAYAANILVVNHALLLSDLAMGGGVLPEYNHLIIDEAHNLEDEATDALGFTVDRHMVMRLLNELSMNPSPDGRSDDFFTDLHSALITALNRERERESKGGRGRMRVTREAVVAVSDMIGQLRPVVERARQSAAELFANLISVLELYQDEQNVYDLRQRITTGVRRHPAWGQVEVVWDNLSLQLRTVEEGLSRIGSLIGEPDWESLAPPEDGSRALSDLVLELHNYLTKVHEVRSNANAAITNPQEDSVYWLEAKVKGGDVALRAAPLHVGPLLDRHLFSTKRTVVLTSATLTTDSEFSYIRERLGLQAAEELLLSSPFDYQKAALIYLPTDVPEPGTPGYQRHVEQTLIELCRASRGRALVLFTSHSALRATYKAIQRPLEDSGIIVLGHNIDGSRRQLLERFKSNPRSVLLGTSSFWEGIDVVGEALSVLVIAKLPFAVPADPVFAARSEGFDDAFNQYAVPQAVLKFKQGFGRLIRSQSDRGVVVLLDRRVLTKRYGQAFLNSLPECTVKRGPSANLPLEVARWLGPNAHDKG